MKILFDETYTSNDETQSSRNIWYGYADISVQGEYGMDIKLDDALIENLCKLIMHDLSAKADNPPTETNWYFYGSTTSQDAIGDDVRSIIMVRERDGQFTINCNISDHDFAVNLDSIISFRADFEKRLADVK